MFAYRNVDLDRSATLSAKAEKFTVFVGSLDGLAKRDMKATIALAEILRRRMESAINSEALLQRYDTMFLSLCTSLEPVVNEMFDRLKSDRH